MTTANPLWTLRCEIEKQPTRIVLIASMMVMGIALLALTRVPVAAHSLADLQAMLGDREKNFRPVDKMSPQFTLQNSEGSPVALKDFQGKVVVLHFASTKCRDGCLQLIQRIAEIQSLVNQSPMKEQVQFITITTDPSSDKGRILTDYGRAHGLDPVNWVFLTAKSDQSEDTTRKLAEQYGHKLEKTEDGYWADEVVTHVIDKEGHWRANFHGLKFEPVNLLVFVNALVNDVAKPHHDSGSSFWQRLKSWF